MPTTRLSFGGDKLELRQGNRLRYGALVDIKEYADAVGAEQLVLRQQAPSADPELGIALASLGPADDLDPRPDAAGVLPAPARAAEPLAQDGP